MRRGFLLLFAIVLAALWTTSAADKGDAAAGKTVFQKRCATCHGPEGEGKAAIAKMMKVELKHLGSKEVQAKSDTDLEKIITQGEGKMKPVAGLSARDLKNLIAFVRSLAQK